MFKLNLDPIPPSQSRSQRIVVAIGYQPPCGPEGRGYYSEWWLVLRITPKCPVKRCHGGQLCDECWFLDYVANVGIEKVIKGVEWAGRGKEPATVVLSGHMISERLDSVVSGWDFDDHFEIVSFDIKPPEPETED